MAESITALVNDTLPSGTTLTTAEVLDYIDVGRSPGGSEVPFLMVQCLDLSPWDPHSAATLVTPDP